jgi:hypothetical protein
MINAREVSMDALRVIDFLIAVALLGGGWFLNNVWSSIKDLQVADKDLADKVSKLEVFVATNYLSTDRFEVVMAQNSQLLNKLGDKIDRLSDKIDTKADKS